MPSTRTRLIHIALLPLSIATLSLSGCGGALDKLAGEPSLPASADATQYKPLMEYCGIDAPTPGIDWSWSHPYHSTNGNLSYNSNALISADGNTNVANGSIDLSVTLTDYRGASGQYVNSGSADPAMNMGVWLLPLFGRQSVACVSPVSRFQAKPPVYTGMPVDPRTQLPDQVWSSYWNHNSVPVAQAGGYAVDAFELTANFTPNSASVFFTLPKSRFSSVQNMPVCYLAPRGAQWNCNPPTITDSGAYWTLSLNDARPGVYMLQSFINN